MTESEYHRRPVRTHKFRGRVFNDRGQPQIRSTRPEGSTRRKTNEMEGILEVQRMLLQKLASQENQVKGFSQGIKGGRGEEAQLQGDLEQLRVDTAQAIQATWSKGSKINIIRKQV
ncbi:hypothetical protein B0J11DRAFT_512213 [Dendryphion nanum]|uniref:Uncharacterized protein n=1 Tax=Dendryphion nanum TaxID=256645 RepID=A0A9P9D2R2_9PLEO|nr:hypothetical protein B0J11DRAFT_512213 [Dendryphion nanum]